MKKESIELTAIQHDLRREFHNILGILKIIKHENLISDREVNKMLEICLEREKDVMKRFEDLTNQLEQGHD